MRIFRKPYFFSSLILLLVLSSLQLYAQQKIPMISASALRKRLYEITNTAGSNFSALKGLPLPAGEFAEKAYKGKIHLVKNDEVSVHEASMPIFTVSYKVRVYTDSNEALVEKAYKKWQSLLMEALPEYTSTVTERNEQRMIYKSFFAPGFEPVKIEVSKNILYNDHWGVWIEISPYSALESKGIKLSMFNDRSTNLEVVLQADDFLTHKGFYAALGPNTDKAYNDRYYIHMPIYMEAGEKAYTVMRSRDFTPMLIVENKSTSTLEQEESDGTLKDSTSDIRKLITATHSGVYDLVFTTVLPEATGSFTVDIFYDQNRRKPDYTAGSFCEKLKYLGLDASLNFAFEEKRKKDSSGVQYYAPVSLLDSSECSLFDLSKFVYECETNGGAIDSVRAQFEVLKDEIAACLDNAEKRVYTKEELSESGEFRILQKTDFKVVGQQQYKISDNTLSYKVCIEMLSTDKVAWIKISVHEPYQFE